MTNITPINKCKSPLKAQELAAKGIDIVILAAHEAGMIDLNSAARISWHLFEINLLFQSLGDK